MEQQENCYDFGEADREAASNTRHADPSLADIAERKRIELKRSIEKQKQAKGAHQKEVSPKHFYFAPLNDPINIADETLNGRIM